MGVVYSVTYRFLGDTIITVSFELQCYRQQAKENLLSEQGIALRKKRSTKPETVFADIKHNRGFRRFSLRGLKKVETEWDILSIAHNKYTKTGSPRLPVFVPLYLLRLPLITFLDSPRIN